MTDEAETPPTTKVKTPKTIKCPGCGNPTIYSLTNPVRPFCSSRCKLGDLSAWASDSYAVPGTQVTEQNLEDETEPLDH